MHYQLCRSVSSQALTISLNPKLVNLIFSSFFTHQPFLIMGSPLYIWWSPHNGVPSFPNSHLWWSTAFQTVLHQATFCHNLICSSHIAVTLKLLKKHTCIVYLVLSVIDCTQPESGALSLLRHPTQESKRTLIERTSFKRTVETEHIQATTKRSAHTMQIVKKKCSRLAGLAA